MHPNQNEMVNIKIKLTDSLKVINLFKWLLDSYVLDFYVDNHWEKMPKSWIKTLSNIPPEHLSDLLIGPQQQTEKTLWPLSLLALRKLLERLSISRSPVKEPAKNNQSSKEKDSNNNPKQDFNCLTHPKICTILTKKKIKEKKRHEIERMGQLTADIARELRCQYIVDFGSGLGHLARLISYGHGLNVCCIEKQVALTEQANDLDNKAIDLIMKFCKDGTTFRKPVHLNICLSEDTSFSELVKNIKNCFRVDLNDDTFRFGIIGLHPCGNLASLLIRFFLQSSEAKFLNLVGCCYFKITTSIDQNNNNKGYPLSEYLTNLVEPKWHHLSFEAREVACHAIEVYADRLSEKNYEYLRIHSYRAAAEKIICKYSPERKRSGLRSIKRLTTFREYCQQAVSHLEGIIIPDHDVESPDTQMNLERWKSVVIFYTLRLMLAPIVESVILYDRILYCIENGCSTKIDAIFDPNISARNHIITAIKP